MTDVSGTVMRYGSAERIACASVKATANNGKIKQALTNDDGDFTLSGLDPGKWAVVVFHEESLPNSPQVVNVALDSINNLQIKLQRLAGQEDEKAGRKFFYGLLYGLGGLIVVYLILHWLFPPSPAGTQANFMWQDQPWRYVEIILWGLAGVLVNKIITSSWYLRNLKFYREGIPMHVAHLVATPLLVFVAVLILSLASLNIKLTGGSEITLDLSEATVLAAVSFLLGSSPWPLWNFIERSSKSITGQVA